MNWLFFGFFGFTVSLLGACSFSPRILSPILQSETVTRNLEVPIELMDQGYGSTLGTDTDVAYSRTSFNTDDYDGTLSYYAEIVGRNIDSSNRQAWVVDSGGNIKATFTIPSGTASSTRYRVTFMPSAGSEEYKLRLEGTTADKDLQVFAARLIIKQVEATKTKIYIPLASNAYGEGENFGTNIYQTTSLTDVAATTATAIFLKENSRFSAIPSGTPWTLEVLLAIQTAGHTAYGSLYNATTGNQVASSELSTGISNGDTNLALVTASFSDTAAHFTDGHEFEFRMRTSNNLQNTRLYKAGLWLKLENLTKGQVYLRQSRRWTGSLLALNDDLQRILLDTSAFSNPTVFYEATGSAVGGGNCGTLLIDHTTQDSGTAGATAVAGSTLTYTGTRARHRSAEFNVASGNRYINQTTWNTAGNSGHVQSGLIIRFE